MVPLGREVVTTLGKDVTPPPPPVVLIAPPPQAVSTSERRSRQTRERRDTPRFVIDLHHLKENLARYQLCSELIHETVLGGNSGGPARGRKSCEGGNATQVIVVGRRTGDKSNRAGWDRTECVESLVPCGAGGNGSRGIGGHSYMAPSKPNQLFISIALSELLASGA
jgi:hypothetical protein